MPAKLALQRTLGENHRCRNFKIYWWSIMILASFPTFLSRKFSNIEISGSCSWSKKQRALPLTLKNSRRFRVNTSPKHTNIVNQYK